jgi:hypothetical protein
VWDVSTFDHGIRKLKLCATVSHIAINNSGMVAVSGNIIYVYKINEEWLKVAFDNSNKRDTIDASSAFVRKEVCLLISWPFTMCCF